MARRAQRRGNDREKRRLEAIAAALGAVVALGTLGLIMWDALTGDGRPPTVLVERLATQAYEGGFVLEIMVSNIGDETASQLVVEGTLSQDGRVVEESGTTFDYVASDSRRRGGLFFSGDPAAYDVSLRAKGYVRP